MKFKECPYCKISLTPLSYDTVQHGQKIRCPSCNKDIHLARGRGGSLDRRSAPVWKFVIIACLVALVAAGAIMVARNRPAADTNGVLHNGS